MTTKNLLSNPFFWLSVCASFLLALILSNFSASAQQEREQTRWQASTVRNYYSWMESIVSDLEGAVRSDAYDIWLIQDLTRIDSLADELISYDGLYNFKSLSDQLEYLKYEAIYDSVGEENMETLLSLLSDLAESGYSDPSRVPTKEEVETVIEIISKARAAAGFSVFPPEYPPEDEAP